MAARRSLTDRSSRSATAARVEGWSTGYDRAVRNYAAGIFSPKQLKEAECRKHERTRCFPAWLSGTIEEGSQCLQRTLQVTGQVSAASQAMKLPKGQLTDPRCLVQQPCRLQEVTLALVGLGHHREDLGIIPVALPDTAEVVGMASASRKVLAPEAIEHAATVADVPGPNPPRECQVRFRKSRPPPFHGVDRLREEVHAGVVPDLREPVVAGNAEPVHKDPPPPRQMTVLIVGVGDPGHHEVLLNVVGPPGCRDFGANGLGHLRRAAKALVVGAEEGDHGVRQVPRADSADIGEPSARIEQDVVEVGGLPLGPDVLEHDVAVASSVEKAPVDGVEPLSVGASTAPADITARWPRQPSGVASTM